MKEKLLIIGTGQHARMLIELIEEQNKYSIVGLISKKKEKKKIYNYPILCSDKYLKKFLKENKDVKNYALGIGDNNGGMVERNKIILESFHGMKDIKVLNLSDKYFTDFKINAEHVANIKTKYATIVQFPRFIFETLAIYGLFFILFTKDSISKFFCS